MTMGGVGIRKSVLDARQRWNDGKTRLRRQHESGATGKTISRALSDLLDSVLLDIYDAALYEISPELESSLAVVLHGGNGRREIAPFSDIDMMLLYQGSLTDGIREFSRRLSQDVTDLGIQLGYSIRTPREAMTDSLEDAYTYSSLTQSRFLTGNEQLYQNFFTRFQRLSNRHSLNLMKGIVAARNKESAAFGQTVYLLRPDVKKSQGALRDLHLIRWLGFVRFGDCGLDYIFARGGLTSREIKQLRLSNEFLLRLRNEMHFEAGRARDRLGRNEQVRIADKFSYPGSEAVLPVESFMRDYFRYTSRVRYICDHYVTTSLRRKNVATRVFSSLSATLKENSKFQMGAKTIGVVKKNLDEVRGDLQSVLHLMQLCGLYEKNIEHETWSAIRETMLETKELELTHPASRRFMALLSNPHRLGQLLRRLHQMQVLGKIIPEFRHARGLLQFNEYHHYTVDQHSLQAIEEVTGLENDPGVVGDAYRKVRRKSVLHLALLLHDLGKGHTEDHCEVGRRIAESIGGRLELPKEDTEDIKFLVHNHLVMSHLAFHRDINDPTLIAEFASNMGSVEMLTMLFVLTYADISAVGPGVLNNWKKGLLTTLFINSKKLLTGDIDGDAMSRRYDRIYEEISEFGDDEEIKSWLSQTARNLPNNYCDFHSPEQIAHQLLVLRKTPKDDAQCWVNMVPGTRLIELCIGKREKRRSGIFYKLTGMLASLGLNIRSADIKPIRSSLVWYWFQLEDADFDQSPRSRLDDIQARARDVVLELNEGPPTFKTKWNKEDSRAVQLSRPKIRVKIDNQTVASATIIDAFTYNELGMLYKISKQIYQLGLDVTYARISTYAHQVINVFYVTDDSGNKIRNENQLKVIQSEILKTVTRFLEPQPIDEEKT